MITQPNWVFNNLWIAHFDILGFKELIRNPAGSLKSTILVEQIDEIIEELKGHFKNSFFDGIDYYFYADTFVIVSKTDEPKNWLPFLNLSQRLMQACIYKRLPIKGAISYGEVIVGHGGKIIIGLAALEAYEYCNDQDWIGLILTPSASQKLIAENIPPWHQYFINQDIPMKSRHSQDVYAHTFINGSANFESPLVSRLAEMKHFTPVKHKEKYQRTIDFIRKYNPVKSSNSN